MITAVMKLDTELELMLAPDLRGIVIYRFGLLIDQLVGER